MRANSIEFLGAHAFFLLQGGLVNGRLCFTEPRIETSIGGLKII